MYGLGKDLNFTGMEYPAGAGLNTSKCCLPGTWDDVLSEIKSWVCNMGKDMSVSYGYPALQGRANRPLLIP
jgi:hypothetical protein